QPSSPQATLFGRAPRVGRALLRGELRQPAGRSAARRRSGLHPRAVVPGFPAPAQPALHARGGSPRLCAAARRRARAALPRRALLLLRRLAQLNAEWLTGDALYRPVWLLDGPLLRAACAWVVLL